MIAHKRFKVIGAVILAVVLTVSMAVPVFASDFDENVTSITVYAWIYDPDTQSYLSASVTTSTTFSEHLIELPFSSYSQNQVWLRFVLSSDSNVVLENFSMAYTLYRNFNGVVSDITPSYFRISFTKRIGSSDSYSYTTVSSREYTLSAPTSARVIDMRFNISAVPSSALTFSFSRFLINGDSTVISLQGASADLADLGEQLEVPKPTIQVANIVEDALDGADYESVGSTTWSFMSNDLITKMLLITVSFALLGYILFGKKESGSK